MAATKTKEPIRVSRKYNEICRNCHGDGVKSGTTCEVCEGSGKVEIIKEIFITVNPLK